MNNFNIDDFMSNSISVNDGFIIPYDDTSFIVNLCVVPGLIESVTRYNVLMGISNRIDKKIPDSIKVTINKKAIEDINKGRIYKNWKSDDLDNVLENIEISEFNVLTGSVNDLVPLISLGCLSLFVLSISIIASLPIILPVCGAAVTIQYFRKHSNIKRAQEDLRLSLDKNDVALQELIQLLAINDNILDNIVSTIIIKCREEMYVATSEEHGVHLAIKELILSFITSGFKNFQYN